MPNAGLLCMLSELLFLFIVRYASSTKLRKQQKSTHYRQSLEEVVLQKISLRMGTKTIKRMLLMKTPPIVEYNVGERQEGNHHPRRVLCFKSNDHHHTSNQTNNGDNHS
jgi:hypothetical protein